MQSNIPVPITETTFSFFCQYLNLWCLANWWIICFTNGFKTQFDSSCECFLPLFLIDFAQSKNVCCVQKFHIKGFRICEHFSALTFYEFIKMVHIIFSCVSAPRSQYFLNLLKCVKDLATFQLTEVKNRWKPCKEEGLKCRNLWRGGKSTFPWAISAPVQ